MNQIDFSQLLSILMSPPNSYYVVAGLAAAVVGLALIGRMRTKRKLITAEFDDLMDEEDRIAQEALELERNESEPASEQVETKPGEDELPESAISEPEPAPEKPAPKPEKKPEPKTLGEGLAKTKQGFIGKLGGLLGMKKEINADLLDNLEELLFTADIGTATAKKLFEAVKEKAKRKELKDAMIVRDLLHGEMSDILVPHQQKWEIGQERPQLILVIGVNGVGKTTTIGKLAMKYSTEGKKVLLAAADTFRAAAIDQLKVWGERANVEVVHGQEGADPASIIYNAVERGKAVGADIVLADTAGRLHTKFNLMEELKKVSRVATKALGREPDQRWLVLDANTGQNAINQARKFNEAIPLDGLILTKLDGTAKGGVVIGITDELHKPIRYIGIGEGIEDLREFDARAFVDALFE